MGSRLGRAAIGAALLAGLTGAYLAAEPASRPATAPTHEEVESIGAGEGVHFSRLSTLRLNDEGNLLACDAGESVIKVVSPEGKLLDTWKMPFAPICAYPCIDGSIYVGGQGKVARLDRTGKVLKTVEAAAGGLPDANPSGISATGTDVFVAFGSSWSLRSTSVIVRFNRDLGEAKTIAKNMRGCCQRLDIEARDGVLYVAENTRYRVVRMDRDGKVLSTWGRKGRGEPEAFGSCCNPMNLCFGSDGVLYTAESGLGRVKRYTPEGKFLGLVGEVGVQRFTQAGRVAASCSNIAIAVTKGGDKVFVQDFKTNTIRVLQRRAGASGRAQGDERKAKGP